MFLTPRIKNTLTSFMACALICSLIMPTAVHANTDLKTPGTNVGTEIAVLSFIEDLPELTPARKLMMATAILAIYRCFSKEPSKEPARVSWSEIKGLLVSPTTLTSSLKNDFNGTLAKFWYALDDLVIGRTYASSSTKTDLTNGKTYVKNSGKPLGIMGTAHAYLKPLRKTIAATVGFGLLLDADFRAGLGKLKLGHLVTLGLVFGCITK